MDLSELKKKGQAPEFLTEIGFTTLKKGYLLKKETPRGMYERVASALGKYVKNKNKEQNFFDIMWDNTWCPASPVLSNTGTKRGLPISCYSIHPEDTTKSILEKGVELGIMSKGGGGVGIFMGEPRPAGSIISDNGISSGVVPWCKIYDSITLGISQGGTRKGASAFYLPIESPDIHEFLDIRQTTGDTNRRCPNTHHAVTIPDSWMIDMLNGDTEKRLLWQKILETREQTGEPFLMWIDNVNKANPPMYKDRGLEVKTSNICTEITLYTDHLHSFVCCLGSLNLMKWDLILQNNVIETAQEFLDCVLQEFIDKAKSIPHLECAVRFAEKGRPIGIGVLGWHSLLQSKNIPFDSFDAMVLNGKIFKEIHKRSDIESKRLATVYGEPEWCKGYGYRNTHRIAVAPTSSNSIISGDLSPGIEPWTANCFIQNTTNGSFIRKNAKLEEVLIKYGKNTDEVWLDIAKNDGSIQHLKFLSKEEKELFKTAREINQISIVKQACQRQKYIDQGQSVNTFFTYDADPKYIHDTHIEFWKNGGKTLYYMRSEGVAKSKIDYKECRACES